MNYKKVIVQWKEFNIPETALRDVNINLDNDFISAVTGPRRAGKTYLCFQTIHHLFKKGISRENILYINFEDEKLIGADANDLNMLLDTYYELSNINNKQKIYLFFDEIQNVKNWDAWIRRIYDMEKNIQIIITGSSSKLLSREISTKLRGRTINTEIFPLSFKEFLNWKKIKYDTKNILYSKEKTKIKKQFSSYMQEGAYPAVISLNSSKETVLQEYYESMIFKDIVERHKIKNVKKLRLLASLLFDSATKDISYSKLANKLKSLGFSLSNDTVIEYISYFEDAYLFFQNLKYEYSINKQLGAIKKVYCIDNGLLNAVSFKFSDDIGKLMENLVYLELKRRNKEIYYHRKNHECDFLIKEKNKIINAIQVTKQLDENNCKREKKGLLEAMNAHDLKIGTIITYGSEDEKKVEGKTIRIVPIWKWLLE
ncbi:MAG: ATP-binding protein [Candidatus Thermoplasmatota archaeon]|nr:ATP-binding protein [Candidatus Thermoplasmatota archaeon]